jgi:hypothetical protein
MLRVIVLLEGFPQSYSQISGRLKQISLYLAPSIIPSLLTSFPVPAQKKHPIACCCHHTSLWGCCSRGDERCWVCTRHGGFLYGQKAQFYSHLTRVPSICLGSLPRAFWQTPNMYAYFSLSNGLFSGHSSVKPSSVECTA